MKRTGAVDRQVIVALILAVPIALLVVATFSPFKKSETGELEYEPPAPKSKAKQPTKDKKAASGDKKGEQPKAVTEPPSQPKQVPTKSAEPEPVVTGWQLPLAPTPREVTEAVRVERARVGCQRLAAALEDYLKHPNNPGKNLEEQHPSKMADLFKPPFDAPSFLPSGKADTIDPWGNEYQVQFLSRKDGTTYPLFFTHSEDQTRISQFGIGKKAWPDE